MTRRLISAAAAVAGLIVIVLAVCSATVWRPSATVTATLASRPDQPYLLVEPGVLGLVDSDVTVEAQASGQTVTLAVGYSRDARSWLADDPYVAVTGLQSWSTLASQVVTERCPEASVTGTASPSVTATTTDSPSNEASVTATDGDQDASASQDGGESGCTELTSSGADPAGGDVWQLTASGQDAASLTLDATDPDLVVLAAAGGSAPAPQLTLTWPRRVSTPWLLPGLVVGGVLVCLGVFGLLMDIQIRHADAQRRRRAAERAARLASADSVATLGIPALNDPNRPLTRRERREKERAEAAGEQWVDPRTGRLSAPASQVPDVPQAPEAHGSSEGASAPVAASAPAPGPQSAALGRDQGEGADRSKDVVPGSQAPADPPSADDVELSRSHAPLPVSADSLSDTQQIEPVCDPVADEPESAGAAESGSAPEAGSSPGDDSDPDSAAVSDLDHDREADGEVGSNLDGEVGDETGSEDTSQDAAARPAQDLETEPVEHTDQDDKEQQQ